MSTNEDSITMLEGNIFIGQLAIDLHRVLGGVLIIRNHSCLAFITIEIHTALSVCNTDTLDGNSWSELGACFANKIVSFVESKFDHTTHTGVLVDVSELGGGLQSSILSLTLTVLTVLSVKLALVLGFFGSEFLFLFSLKLFNLFLTDTASTATTIASSSSAACSELFNLLSQLSNQLVLSRLIDNGIILDSFNLPSIS